MVPPTVLALLRTPAVPDPLLLLALLLSSHPRASLVPSWITCSSSFPFLRQLRHYIAVGRPLLMSPTTASPALSPPRCGPTSLSRKPSFPGRSCPMALVYLLFPPQMIQSETCPVSDPVISCVLMLPGLLPPPASSFPGWSSPGGRPVVARLPNHRASVAPSSPRLSDLSYPFLLARRQALRLFIVCLFEPRPALRLSAATASPVEAALPAC